MSETPNDPKASWPKLPVEHLHRPTFWPAGFALATTFIFWGLVSSWVITAIGIIQFAGCLAGWVNELRHERKHDTH